MVTVIKLTKQNLDNIVQAARQVIEDNGLLIYPTDTLYGIGGNGLSKSVVAKINNAKQITKPKPMSVIVAGISMIKYYCEVSDQQEEILNKYLPGPFTFLLKAKTQLPVTNNPKLGIRIPENEFCIKLSKACNRPIITTSANKTGKPPPQKFSDVDKNVLDIVDLAIDSGGETIYKQGSEVVDLVDKKIIRKGEKNIDQSLLD